MEWLGRLDERGLAGLRGGDAGRDGRVRHVVAWLWCWARWATKWDNQTDPLRTDPTKVSP